MKTQIDPSRTRQPDIHEYTLPAYWASYLINGDASGLDEAEKAHCDTYLSEQGLSRRLFTDCGEQFFSSRSDAGGLAGDVCLFTYRAS